MKFSSGGDSEEDTPVPIPNTEVKLFSVECSWVYALRDYNVARLLKSLANALDLLFHSSSVGSSI